MADHPAHSTDAHSDPSTKESASPGRPEPTSQSQSGPPQPQGQAPQSVLPTGDIVEIEKRAVRWWQPVLILAVLGLLYYIARQFGLLSALINLREDIDAFGPLAPLVFIPIYLVLTLLWVPGSVLTATAGALFGAVLGVTVSLVASTLSATAAFLIARYFARQRVSRWLTNNKSFKRLDRLTEKHGAFVVLVTRLINLFPFAMVNYGFGLTRIPLGTYVLWSFLGKIPGTIVIVVGIDAIYQALRHREVPWAAVITVVVMTGLLTTLITFLKRKLDDAPEINDPPDVHHSPHN